GSLSSARCVDPQSHEHTGTTVMQRHTVHNHARIAAGREKSLASKRTSLPGGALDRKIDQMIASGIATLAKCECVMAEAARGSVKSFASRRAALRGAGLARLTDQMIERGDRIAARALAEREMAVKAARASALSQEKRAGERYAVIYADPP